MRVLISTLIFTSLMFFTFTSALAEPERTQLGESSVSMIIPDNVRKKADPAVLTPAYLPAFRVHEEPKSFVKMWTPRLTDKKTAKAFAKQSNSKFIKLMKLEINGEQIPILVTYVKTAYKTGHVYKALFDAENSIIVIATIFDDAPITEEEVLNAFKTIEIDVQNPIGDFDGAPFTVDLTPPFEFVFADFSSLFIKSYPEIDESYSKPSIIIGYEDIFVYEGKPLIEDAKMAGQYLFPIDKDNFFLDEEPSHSKLKIISHDYVNLGPGKAYRIEATYKGRMCIQYVWDIQGKSEFDDYLFLFAMGDTKHLEPLRDEVANIATSLKLKAG